MQIKNYIKKYYPFILLFIIVLIFNIFMDIKQADFIWFLDKAKTTNMIDYLSFRYFNWTSRIIIEFVLVGILKLNYVLIFKIVNTIVMFLIPCILLKLFSKNKDIKSQFFVIVLYLCYNFKLMNTAGWYATLINYMWPLLCLLIGLIPIKNYFDNKQDKWYLNLLYIISIIFTCNHEQTCAILFGIYLLFFIYSLLNKKTSKFSIISLIISLLSIVFILTCPGNLVRSVSETSLNYPEYASFDLVQKIGLSLSTIMTEYIINYNVLLFVLCIIISIILFKKSNKIITKIISLIPIISILILNYSSIILHRISPKLLIIRNIFLEENIRRYVFDKPKLLVLIIISIIFLLIIIYNIIKALYEKEKFTLKMFMEKYYILLIFLIGLASRLIIGFSSSIFASGFRTNIFFDFSIIISTILMLNKYEKYLKNEKKYIIIILSIVSILNVANIYISL